MTVQDPLQPQGPSQQQQVDPVDAILATPLSGILDRIEQQEQSVLRFVPEGDTALRGQVTQQFAKQKAQVGFAHSMSKIANDDNAKRRAAALQPESISSEEQVLDYFAFRLRSRLSGRQFALLTDQDKQLRAQFADEISRIGGELDPSRRRALRQLALSTLDEATITPQEAAQGDPDFQRAFQETRARLRGEEFREEGGIGVGIARATIPAVRAISETLEGVIDLVPGIEVREGVFGDAIADVVGSMVSAFNDETPDVTRFNARALARIGKPIGAESPEFDFIIRASELLGVVVGFKGVGKGVKGGSKFLQSIFGQERRVLKALATNHSLTNTAATGFLLGAGRERGGSVIDRTKAGLSEAVTLTAMIGGGAYMARRLIAPLRASTQGAGVTAQRGVNAIESMIATSPFVLADPEFRHLVAQGEFGKAALVASPTIGVFGAMGAFARVRPQNRSQDAAADQVTQASRLGDADASQRSSWTRDAVGDMTNERHSESYRHALKQASAGEVDAAEVGPRMRQDLETKFNISEKDWDPAHRTVLNDSGKLIEVTQKNATSEVDLEIGSPLSDFQGHSRQTLDMQRATAKTFDQFVREAVEVALENKVSRLRSDPKVQREISEYIKEVPAEFRGRIERQLGMRAETLEAPQIRELRKIGKRLNEIKNTPTNEYGEREQELIASGRAIGEALKKMGLEADSMEVEMAERHTGKPTTIDLLTLKQSVDHLLGLASRKVVETGRQAEFRELIIRDPSLVEIDARDMVDKFNELDFVPDVIEAANTAVTPTTDPNRTLTPLEAERFFFELQTRLNPSEAKLTADSFEGKPVTVRDVNRVYRDIDARRRLRNGNDLSPSEKRAAELIEQSVSRDMTQEAADAISLAAEEIGPASDRVMNLLSEARRDPNPEVLRELVRETFNNPTTAPGEKPIDSLRLSLDPVNQKVVKQLILEEMGRVAEINGDGRISPSDAKAIKLQARRFGIEKLEVQEKANDFARELDKRLNEDLKAETGIGTIEEVAPIGLEQEGRPVDAGAPGPVSLEGPRGAGAPGEAPTVQPGKRGRAISRVLDRGAIETLGTRLKNFKANRASDADSIARAAQQLGILPETLSPTEARAAVDINVRNLIKEAIVSDPVALASLKPNARRVLSSGVKEKTSVKIVELIDRVKAKQRVEGEESAAIKETQAEFESVVDGRVSSKDYVTDGEIRNIINREARNPYPEDLPIFRPETNEIVNNRVDRPSQWERQFERIVSSEVAARIAEKRGATELARDFREVRNEFVQDLQANMKTAKRVLRQRVKKAREDLTQTQTKFIESVTQARGEKPKRILEKPEEIDKLFSAKDHSFALKPGREGFGYTARMGREGEKAFIEIEGANGARVRFRDRDFDMETLKTFEAQGEKIEFNINAEALQHMIGFRNAEKRSTPWDPEVGVRPSLDRAADFCGCLVLALKQGRIITAMVDGIKGFGGQFRSFFSAKSEIAKRATDPTAILSKEGLEATGKDISGFTKLFASPEEIGGSKFTLDGAKIVREAEASHRRVVGNERVTKRVARKIHGDKDLQKEHFALLEMKEADAKAALERDGFSNDFIADHLEIRGMVNRAREESVSLLKEVRNLEGLPESQVKAVEGTIKTLGTLEGMVQFLRSQDPVFFDKHSPTGVVDRAVNIQASIKSRLSGQLRPGEAPRAFRKRVVEEAEGADGVARDPIQAIADVVTSVTNWASAVKARKLVDRVTGGVRNGMLGRDTMEVEWLKQGDFVWEKGKEGKEDWVITSNLTTSAEVTARNLKTGKVRTISYEDIVDGKFGTRQVGFGEFGIGVQSPELLSAEALQSIKQRPVQNRRIEALEKWLSDNFASPGKKTPWEKVDAVLASWQYTTLLGMLSPKPAATQLLQSLNAIGEGGPTAYAEAGTRYLKNIGRLQKEGVIGENVGISDLADAQGFLKKVTKGKAKEILDKGWILFDAAENFTRGTAWLMFEKQALAKGMSPKAAKEVAWQKVSDTMFIYDRTHAPELLRKRGLRSVFALSTFTHRATSTMLRSLGAINKITDPVAREKARRGYVRQMVTWAAASYMIKELTGVLWGDDHKINTMTSIGTDLRNIPVLGEPIDNAFVRAGVEPDSLLRVLPVQTAGLGPSPAIQAAGDLLRSTVKAIESGSRADFDEAVRRRRKLLFGRTVSSVFDAYQVAEHYAGNPVPPGGIKELFGDRIVRLPLDSTGEVPEKPLARVVNGRVMDTFDFKDFLIDQLVPGSVVNQRRRWDVKTKIRLEEGEQRALRDEIWDKFSTALMSKDQTDLQEAREFWLDNAGASALDSHKKLRVWLDDQVDRQLLPPAVRTAIGRRSQSERLLDLMPGGATRFLLEEEPSQALTILNTIGETPKEIRDKTRGENPILTLEAARAWGRLRREIRDRLQ